MLAVPVQGFAAAGMLNCASGGAPSSLQHAHERGADARHSHQPGAAHGPNGHMHPSSGNDADDVAHTGAAAADGLAAGLDHKCSACAACHLGVALLPATVALPEQAPAAAPSLAPQVRPVSFVTGGPDRPPRIEFA